MEWISLMDYATTKGVSLSTLRRHIKANKIPYKVENGRYLLPLNAADNPTAEKIALQKAQEEIAELKTLIAFYEEKLPKQRFDI
jgi:predicted site-specific integrase-resolvase